MHAPALLTPTKVILTILHYSDKKLLSEEILAASGGAITLASLLVRLSQLQRDGLIQGSRVAKRSSVYRYRITKTGRIALVTGQV